MDEDRDNISTIEMVARPDVKGELLLALLTTVTVLVVHWQVKALTRQRLLFASLASSAFFLYLDPHHGTNTTCALVSSHLMAGAVAPRTHQLFGHGDLAAARTMVTAILAMVLLDVVDPPAVSPSLGFALGTRAGA